MFFPIANLCRRAGVAPARRRPARVVLRVEALEARLQLSLGGAVGVAVNGSYDVYSVANASSSNGTRVAAFVEQIDKVGGVVTTVDLDVQRYNAAGSPVGALVVVAGGAPGTISKPVVATDGSGNFVVVWTTLNSAGHEDIYGSTYNAGGSLTNTFPVAHYAGNSSQPSVAMAQAGNFVVSFTYQYGNGLQNDIYATSFTARGASTGTIAVEAINGYNQTQSAVAMSPDGRFDVAFMDAYGTQPSGIIVNRYSAGASLLSSAWVVTPGNQEYQPSISLDNNANAVVSWYELKGIYRNVYAKQMNNLGAMYGTIAITNTTLQADDPTVVMNRTTGSFAISYMVGFTNTVTDVTEVNANGTIRATYSAGGYATSPSLSMGAGNSYFLTYSYQFTGYPMIVMARFGILT